MGNLLGILPTGIGDLAHSLLDSVLPKELSFLGGAVGGVIDLETGNLAGATKHLLDSVLDLKDLAQNQKASSDAPPSPTNQCWSHEPTPPTSWRASPPATTPASALASAASPPTPTADAASLSKASFLGLPDDALMSAIRDGKIPKEIAESKDGMLALQARMTQITEMNQLMTSMLQAIHQLRMGVIQNLRV